MLQKKICMLGAPAVGKTSLISRYVRQIFSDTYLSTIGVKIDEKDVFTGNQHIKLLIWDLFGTTDPLNLPDSYLRGMAGYILVADGTRSETLEMARNIKSGIDELRGELPFIVAINKHDLDAEWQIAPEDIDTLTGMGWEIVITSAKSGAGVETLFQQLAGKTVELAA